MEKNNVQGIAIVRLEQLYPLDQKELETVLASYDTAEKVWVQEEPANMGAWTYIQTSLPQLKLKVISRKIAASPATGYKKLHDENQARIVSEALTL
jgi:2-oxoglutarate dehydrogenase E1 component